MNKQQIVEILKNSPQPPSYMVISSYEWRNQIAEEILVLYSRNNCTLVPTDKLKEMQERQSDQEYERGRGVGVPLGKKCYCERCIGKHDVSFEEPIGETEHGDLVFVKPPGNKTMRAYGCECKYCRPELWAPETQWQHGVLEEEKCGDFDCFACYPSQRTGDEVV